MPRTGINHLTFYPDAISTEILSSYPRGQRSKLLNQALQKLFDDQVEAMDRSADDAEYLKRIDDSIDIFRGDGNE